MKVQLEFKSCEECPFLEVKPVPSADSWSRPEAWFCKKEKEKKIDGYVDWYDKVKIPEWCPIKVE